MQLLCQVLAMRTAGYYYWRQHPVAVPTPWQAAVQAAFTHRAQCYGTRQLRAELCTERHVAGPRALHSWRHGQGVGDGVITYSARYYD